MKNGVVHNSEQEKAETLYAYILEFATTKLESETRREDSLIQQASTMQTAFSFTTAALFMVAPIAVEYRGNMSLPYLLAVFSSVTALLMLSLVFASTAQNRQLTATFPDIDILTKHIEEHYNDYVTKAQQDKALSELIGTVQKSKDEINDKRVKRIRWSMRFFYAALGLSAIWFLISISILF